MRGIWLYAKRVRVIKYYGYFSFLGAGNQGEEDRPSDAEEGAIEGEREDSSRGRGGGGWRGATEGEGRRTD